MSNPQATAQAVLDYIRVNPERHAQITWVGIRTEFGDIEAAERLDLENFNICSTTMCIAGTAVFLTQGLDKINEILSGSTFEEDGYKPWVVEGAKALGIHYDEAYELFFDLNNDSAILGLEEIARGKEDN